MWSATRTKSRVMAGYGYFAYGSYDEGAGSLLEEVLRLVRRPTPAKVRRKAQRLRLPRARS
jgi:hypothetical protein